MAQVGAADTTVVVANILLFILLLLKHRFCPSKCRDTSGILPHCGMDGILSMPQRYACDQSLEEVEYQLCCLRFVAQSSGKQNKILSQLVSIESGLQPLIFNNLLIDKSSR